MAGCANSPREAVAFDAESTGIDNLPKGCLAVKCRWAASQQKREYDGAAARVRTTFAMAPGYFYCCLLAVIATAADQPRVGAEERGLVTRLNRRYRGGLCFKAFIRWSKQGRERVRGRAEIDFTPSTRRLLNG